jgi:hypothetical protein
MRNKHIAILLLAVLGLCGCSSRHSNLDSTIKRLTVPEKTLLAITNGVSFEAITNTFGIAARLEFTCAETNGNYTLISCYFAGGDNALWLVFHDKALMKIIEPFSFPELLETYPYQGTTATRIKSWDIDDPGINDRVKKVIDAPALTHEEVAAELRPYTNADPSSSSSVTPVFLFSGILGKEAPQIEKDYAINESLLDRYNGCSANIGMDTNEVEKLYGKPLRVFATKSGEIVRIYRYGETRELQVNPQLVFRGLAIVSDAKGQVTAIYSNGFFDDKWKK